MGRKERSEGMMKEYIHMGKKERVLDGSTPGGGGEPVVVGVVGRHAAQVVKLAIVLRKRT